MKRTTAVTLALFTAATVINAEQKAVTGNGNEVILHDNGTWNYVNNKKQVVPKIKLNRNTFSKSKDATFLVKSKRNDSAFYINPQKWLFKKGNGGPKEYIFQLKGKSLWGMAITEEITGNIEILANIGIENARKVDPNVQVVTKEYRTVNGLKVIYMEMKGAIKGIKFMYLGYYYADKSGVTQFVAYTSPNLVPKYRTEIDEFLNGLVKK